MKLYHLFINEVFIDNVCIIRVKITGIIINGSCLFDQGPEAVRTLLVVLFGLFSSIALSNWSHH